MRSLITFLLLLSFHLTFAQQTPKADTYRDTVFRSLGDTLIGKITIDKDANKYFFVSDTIAETELDPKTVLGFVVIPKDDETDKLYYSSIIGDFYLLETGANDIITMYAKPTFKAVENDGPKYYTVKKKYCLFKNKVIYFPDKNAFKDIMLFLTKDCFDINNKIKNNTLGLNDLPVIVTGYNHCNSN